MTQPMTQLVITLDQSGNVQVQGPIEQKMLCYGLLKCAEDAISQYKPQPKPLVEVVRPNGTPEKAIAFDAKVGRRP